MSAAINIAQRLYVDEGGVIFPITNFFDGDGDECEPDDAVTVVAGEGGCWYALRLSDFEQGNAQ